jgi:membrane protein
MVALIYFFMIGMGVVMGAELNAALAETDGTALKGEVYTGPFKDQLEVEEPEPGEDVPADLVIGEARTAEDRSSRTDRL